MDLMEGLDVFEAASLVFFFCTAGGTNWQIHEAGILDSVPN